MAKYNSDVAFSSAVKAQQERLGSREAYARRMEKRDWSSVVTEDLAAFIAARDSFYFATASADGQPYVQHRGGPPGFLTVLDEQTLAFGDFGGNQQYVTLGNLSENDRAQIFLMDYANRRRVKIWGRARVVEDDPALISRLSENGYPAGIDRVIVFTITAWDANCPQHIVRRFSEREIAPEIQRLHARIAELERELAVVRSARD